MENILPGYNTEAFCGIVIDALKELKRTSQPVTPRVLHEALIARAGHIALPAGKENDSLNKSHLRELKDFRLKILHEFEDTVPLEFAGMASEIRELIRESNGVQQILDVNDKILEIVRSATSTVSGDLEQFACLVKEIGLYLLEMETGLISSLSCTRETFEKNKAFNNALERGLEDATETIEITTNPIELKGLIVAKLSTIMTALERKARHDEIQFKKSKTEVKKLRQCVKEMKHEIIQIQQKAKVLEKETLIDPLTGVGNRRAYEKRIKEEFGRFIQNQEMFSILLLDIDHFKSINDHYGHWTGDRCLEALTTLIQKILRGTDFLARYGGEEFITILPETGADGLGVVAEKLRAYVERARFLYQKDQEIPLTVSIGGTTVNAADEDAETVFNRVDTAMYEAKRKGRNRVVIL